MGTPKLRAAPWVSAWEPLPWEPLPRALPPTPYARFGDWGFALLLALGAAGAGLATLIERTRRTG